MDYELVLFGASKSRSAAKGELRSPMLDSVLHPSQSIPILVGTSYRAEQRWKDEQTCTIESLQLRSVEQYLLDQTMLRTLVETELTAARKNWLGLQTSSVADMWADTSSIALELPCRQLVNIESGFEETQTAYSIYFRVGWDDEHGERALKFRDQVYLGLGMPGD